MQQRYLRQLSIWREETEKSELGGNTQNYKVLFSLAYLLLDAVAAMRMSTRWHHSQSQSRGMAIENTSNGRTHSAWLGMRLAVTRSVMGAAALQHMT